MIHEFRKFLHSQISRRNCHTMGGSSRMGYVYTRNCVGEYLSKLVYQKKLLSVYVYRHRSADYGLSLYA